MRSPDRSPPAPEALRRSASIRARVVRSAALAAFGLALVGCAPLPDSSPVAYAGPSVVADANALPSSLVKRAQSGDAHAAFALGVQAAVRKDGVDDAEAARWFRQAADAGIAEAQFNLGVLYAEGRGVTRDPALATHWFRLAAEHGIMDAQYDLGRAYLLGTGVPKDGEEAELWLRRAARSGLAEAQYDLGLMLERGDGVPADGHAALGWFDKAAGQGYAPARILADALRKRLHVSGENESRPAPAPESSVAGGKAPASP